MYKILNKIQIKQQVDLTKKIFINEQLNHPIITSFYCCNCQHKNELIIIPYKTGFPLLDLYVNSDILNENEILQNKIASNTSKQALHHGNYTVGNLPTLYFGNKCEECEMKYLVVFSLGEKQPGLEILEISGVWAIR
jgi:hypothetical protein